MKYVWKIVVRHSMDEPDRRQSYAWAGSRYIAGYVQNEIDKMNEEDRTALLQFLEEGREVITGTVGCSIKCVAHDFGKALESFVAKLEAKTCNDSSVH